MGAVLKLPLQAQVTLATHGPALVSNGYRIVPIEPGTKSPNVAGWSKIKANQSTLDKWISEGRGNWGIGILGEETPGIDFDISDKAVLDNVTDWCRKNIGVDNSRVGRAPRALSTYRADVPFGKMSSAKFEAPDGSTHQIEILGKGNQYVAYAVHPDTQKPYSWSGLDPLVMPAELLPTLTPEKAKALIEYFESIVPASWKPVSKSSAKTAAEHEGNPVKVAQLHRLRSAVEAIPNKDLPYDEWVRVMYGLWAAVGENKFEGFEIFDDWSSKSAKYDFEETLRVWEATHDVRHIGAGTLFHLARENGWVEPIEDMTAWMEVVDDIEDERPGDDEVPVPKRRNSFLSYDEMIRMPKAEWLVGGVLPARASTLMFGKSNTFKSFLAIDLALSIVSGRSWHGCSVKQGRVAIVATEGANGVGGVRVPGWFDHYSVPHDLRPNIFLRPLEVAIDDKKDIGELLADILELGPFDLVVFDIFGGTMFGSETEDTTARAWVHGIQRLMRNTGAATLTVAHTGWSDQTRARMHTHFWGSFDTRLRVEGDRDARTSALAIERHKDFDSSGSWGFRLEKSHGTLVPLLDESAKPAAADLLSPTEKTALHALHTVIIDHGERRSGNGWPLEPVVDVKLWRDRVQPVMASSDKPDTLKRAFNRAKKALIDRGLIGERENHVWAVL